ncbi:Fur family transcriptional regulator [Lichenicoccus sp.]|uniref:Fur family transcriptional regulator n=1 Tax=Lichenicoccus sp. TaxID=2781899 RepID=UPI003D12D2CD
MDSSGYSPEIEQQLAAAARICDRRETRLTSLRRQVLALVLDTERPATAYDLLDRLREHHKGAAPPTIYRALDFLLEQGLIHKVERLSAYVGCIQHGHGHKHLAEGDSVHHAAQFLICRQCGAVLELEDAVIGSAIGDAARRVGFRPLASTIEIEGLCARCAA